MHGWVIFSERKGSVMKTFHLLSVTAILIILTSCQSLHEKNVSDDFDKGSKEYIHKVRWHELEDVPLYFVSDPLRDDFKKRVVAARDVQIADYRVKDRECRPREGKAEVTVEWDYYIPPSVKLKTVEDPQKWQYFENEEKRGWMLMTLFPEFK